MADKTYTADELLTMERQLAAAQATPLQAAVDYLNSDAAKAHLEQVAKLRDGIQTIMPGFAAQARNQLNAIIDTTNSATASVTTWTDSLNQAAKPPVVTSPPAS